MAAEAFEGSVELPVEVLEPIPAEFGTCGPFQKLRRTGQMETRAFHTLVLENSFVRFEVFTELGGRIGRIVDLTSKRAVLDLAEGAGLITGGNRGVVMPGGVSVTFNGTPRPNDLGRVDWLLEPTDDGGTAGLWIGENCCGALGMHVHMSLPADSSELTIEARLLNRSDAAIHYNGGLRFGGDFEFRATQGAYLAWNAQKEGGLAFWSDDIDVAIAADGMFLARFNRLRSMAPRQLDTWKAVLMPVSGLRGGVKPYRGAVAALDEGHLQVVASHDHAGHKLVVQTRTGETLESQVDLKTSELLKIPVEAVGGEPLKFAVLRPDRSPLVYFEPGSGRLRWRKLRLPEPLEPFPDPSKRHLRDESFRWPWRAFTEAILGRHDLAEAKYSEADYHFEQSLLYNAEDHLVWWLKSACNRLEGREGENAELLNAHYLAPLEPVLRAEAFLDQPSAMSSEPNPLLRSFDDTPLNFVEAACLLVDAGLFADATRWIDEAIRHQDMPMLRYLQAYCLLVASRLDAEAAHQVVTASRLPFGPPFPFRRIEKLALGTLKEKFPADDLLDRYFRLA